MTEERPSRVPPLKLVAGTATEPRAAEPTAGSRRSRASVTSIGPSSWRVPRRETERLIVDCWRR